MALNYKLHRTINRLLSNNRSLHNWTTPEGYNTGIKVFNCVTKTKVPLILNKKSAATWYTCGPTVYDSSHIGHASCYVKLDIIQRILRDYYNINLITVMNVTDIDDKIIKRSRERNVDPVELAQKYEKEFWQDLTSCKVELPNVVLRVTEKMDLIVKFVQKLLSENKAYKTSDNSVYFDVATFAQYGKLQNINEDLQSTDINELKKSSKDFALWKGHKEGEPFWEAPWGPGRPGWHIECSALATHALGSSIDIHAGGIDLRFPHHENEEAQSCAFHNKTQWVNYWLHTGHLHIKHSEKMSKSLQNTISIQDFLETTSPDVFRMACLMNHYRNDMEFSEEFMETAGNVLKTYKNFVSSVVALTKTKSNFDIKTNDLQLLLDTAANKVQEAFADDFDTPSAIKVLSELVHKTNSTLHNNPSNTHAESSNNYQVIAVVNFVVKFLELFEIDILYEKSTSDSSEFGEVMEILNSFRQDVRQVGIAEKNKDILRLCDSVRDDLKKMGIVVKDHGKISSWSR